MSFFLHVQRLEVQETLDPEEGGRKPPPPENIYQSTRLTSQNT